MGVVGLTLRVAVASHGAENELIPMHGEKDTGVPLYLWEVPGSPGRYGSHR